MFRLTPLATVLIATQALVAHPAAAQTTLLAGDRAKYDKSGSAVALDGNLLLVGAPEHNLSNGSKDTGSATLYRYDGTKWALEKIFVHPSPAKKDYFATAVAVSQEFVVCGVPKDNTSLGTDAGSVQVFRFDGQQWKFLTQLLPPAGEKEDVFGSSVALYGDDLVVGAPGTDDDTGIAYVYHFNGATFDSPALLFAPGVDDDDEFGYSVAITDGTVVIGAPGKNGDQGAAYVFHRFDSGWSYTDKFVPATSHNARFGQSVAIDTSHMAIGAPEEEIDDEDEAGAVYTFSAIGPGSYANLNRIENPDPDSHAWFGESVAIAATRLAIGAPGDDSKSGDAGVAYLFHHSSISNQVPAPSPGFYLANKLLPSDLSGGDLLGKCVAITKDYLAAGAPLDDVTPPSSGSIKDGGSVRVFTQP